MHRISRLYRLVPLITAGLAVLVLSSAPPAEAGPKGDRSRGTRTVQKHSQESNQKPRVQRQAPRGRRDAPRDQAYRAPRHHEGPRHPAYRAPRHAPQRHYRHRSPRVVRVPTAVYCAPARPWWESSRRVYVGDEPFFFHAGLGIYLGGLALSIQIGDGLPAGYGYYDPYCGTTLGGLDGYADHCGYGGHDAVVSLVVLDRDGWGR